LVCSELWLQEGETYNLCGWWKKTPSLADRVKELLHDFYSLVEADALLQTKYNKYSFFWKTIDPGEFFPFLGICRH
jgi:hypothetical protein